jgi:hypothetical protein
LDQGAAAELSRVQSLLQEINPNPVSTEIDDISSSLLRLLTERDVASITLIGSELFDDKNVSLPDSVILTLTRSFLCDNTPKRIGEVATKW